MDSKKNIPESYLRSLNSVIPTSPIQYLYAYDFPKVAIVLLRKSDSGQHQPRKVSIFEINRRSGLPDQNAFIKGITKMNIRLPPAHLAQSPIIRRIPGIPPGNVMYTTRTDSSPLSHQPNQQWFGMHSFSESLENFNPNRGFPNKIKNNNFNQQSNQSNKGRYNDRH